MNTARRKHTGGVGERSCRAQQANGGACSKDIHHCCCYHLLASSSRSTNGHIPHLHAEPKQSPLPKHRCVCAPQHTQMRLCSPSHRSSCSRSQRCRMCSRRRLRTHCQVNILILSAYSPSNTTFKFLNSSSTALLNAVRVIECKSITSSMLNLPFLI